MNELPSMKHLHYFSVLADTGHYRKAAERIGISQPSLSQQISNMEALLGVRLVERGRARVTLTPAGRDVLDRTRRVLDGVTGIVDACKGLKGGQLGTIRLGSSPTLGPYILPHLVRRLHAQHPDLRLFIRDAAPRDLQIDLLNGTYDLILTQLPVQSTDIVTRRLFREPFQLAVARDHELAGRKKATDSDLAGQEVLTLGSAFALHTQISRLCDDVGAVLRLDYEGTSLDALRQMTAMNMGVTLLPALYIASEIRGPDPEVHTLVFRRNTFCRSVGLVWRKASGRQAAFDLFADLMRDVALSDFRSLVYLDG